MNDIDVITYHDTIKRIEREYNVSLIVNITKTSKFLYSIDIQLPIRPFHRNKYCCKWVDKRGQAILDCYDKIKKLEKEFKWKRN